MLPEPGTLRKTLEWHVADKERQGCDTDSFGCTAGSILGAFFGPGHLDPRWLKPFNDDLHTSLSQFYERSLSACAKRMGRLPALVADSLRRAEADRGRNAATAGQNARDGL